MPETQLERSGAVLTLAEAAAFLRVTEEALSGLAIKGAIPAQKIAGEWRFLKRALVDWLRYGRLYREFRGISPSWEYRLALMEGFLALIEQRDSVGPASRGAEDKPGSKESVLKHFGIFHHDDDLETTLEDLRARREEAG